jgi:ATP-binding cassette subfamily C protein
MLKAVKASLAFMTPKERSKWYFLTGLRALLSLLDLLGILAIGFIATSTALFLTSGSDGKRIIEFANLEIPAVNAQTLPWVSAGVLVLFLVKAVLSVILTRKAAFFVATIEARSAKTIAEIALGGDLTDARRRSREEIMYAIQAGSPAAFNGLLNAANAFATESFLFFVICLGFLFIDPLATLGAVIYFGLIAFVIQFFVGALMTKAGQISADGTVAANTAISDLLSVFRELLVLGKREKYIDEIYRARVEASDGAANQYYLGGMPRYIIEAALLVGIALFVLAQAFAGDIVKSAATIGVFLSGGFRLTAALLPLQNSILNIKASIPSAQRAQKILEMGEGHTSFREPHTHLNLETTDSSKSISGRTPIGVELRNVSFTYPGSSQATLRNVSIDIQPGSQVALMGPSGAGKSTIADLLCDVLTPTSGRILRTSSTNSSGDTEVTGQVSYVPQRPGLVSGTILANVALADTEMNISRVQAIKALELANLSQLIEDLPDGLNTSLGNLQDGLSGGQMQRLGLARALYTSPGLLVMDEATSALDAESEAEIQKALESMRGKVTVVLIAHRLNTIQHADQVILLEDGQVKDSGTFKELIARNPQVERAVELMSIDRV